MTLVMARTTIAIVPGEEELGQQKHCPRCRGWFPADGEFWSEKRPGVWRSWCRACVAECSATRRRTRTEEGTA